MANCPKNMLLQILGGIGLRARQNNNAMLAERIACCENIRQTPDLTSPVTMIGRALV